MIIQADGSALHVRQDGPENGRAILFINSLGTDLRVWDRLLPHLPKGLRLVRYDKRGHGLSGLGPAGAGLSIETLADDAIAICEALKLEDVTLVGLSIGGLIAQAVALKRPDLARAMVLMDTAMRIGTAEMWGERIAALEAGGIAAISDAVLARWFAPEFLASSEAAMWRAMLERTPLEGYIACCRALAGADYTGRAAEVKCPVLALCGALDGSTPPDLVRATAEAYGAPFHLIDNAGHLPPVEQPEAVADLLSAFLKDTDEGGGRYAAGMRVRRSVLGDAHVDRAEAAKTKLDDAFQTLITESAWGTVWASDAISRRERSMLTLALLAATGNFDEIPMHIRATARTGASRQDVVEAFQHVAIYAGVPRANHALKLAKAAFAEMEENDDD
ncbi:3-oxoadipate enol-lactonase [Martelella radicis]|uniref:3-oxoadipate enol-lactonase/4-carboxymuconolactone decarboxylase n=1 Tax=Martelella radicis TaxID=1397476 RepID=A0A7W6KJ85_9HYPH|nr:3-oxoadipate enol-lactonase [Martelella radicis]MBB4121219.1 3-oxoadipate enol-lactonase/4-carboxymuconolactone decarboxylase [Martelella radicis]